MPVFGILGNEQMNERTGGGRVGLFRSNNSGREQHPEMWLIGGRELVRPSESRGYFSIDPRPREASTAFRVIRGTLRANSCFGVSAFPSATRCRGIREQYATLKGKHDSFSLMQPDRAEVLRPSSRRTILYFVKTKWDFDLEARRNRGLLSFTRRIEHF